MVRRAYEWLFRSRQTGQIVIAQFPNVALGLYLAVALTRRVFDPTGAVRTTLDWVAVGALAWWAVDEVARGVNPWRRALGAFGCFAAASGVWALVR